MVHKFVRSLNHNFMNMMSCCCLGKGVGTGTMSSNMFEVNSVGNILYRCGDCVCLVLAKINRWVL